MLLESINLIIKSKRETLVKPKLILLNQIFKLIIIYSLIKLKLLKPPNHMNLFGIDYQIGDYEIFLKTFLDIFIKSQYFFESSTLSPEIVDYGSHIGLSVLYFKLLFPNSHIVAVEADPNTFKMLKRNIKYNNIKNVEIFNCIVSNITNDQMPFYSKDKNSADWGNSSIKKEGYNSKSLIQSMKASTFIGNQVDMLKIDIEGSEFIAIKELSESNKLKKVRNMIAEYHRYPADSNLLPDILKVLKENGYEFLLNYYWKLGSIIIPTNKTLKKYGDSYNVLIYAERSSAEATV